MEKNVESNRYEIFEFLFVLQEDLSDDFSQEIIHHLSFT